MLASIRQYPLLVMFLALALGIFLGDLYHLERYPLFFKVLIPGLLVLLLLAIKLRTGVVLVSLLLVILTGAWSATKKQLPEPTRDPCPRPHLANPLDPDNRWRVAISGPSERVVDQNTQAIQRRTTVLLLAKHCGNELVPARGRLRLTLQAGEPVVRGDLLELRLNLLPPLNFKRNYTGLEPQTLNRHEGLTARGYALSPHALLARSKSFLSYIDRLRDHISAALETPPFTAAEAALAKALALGDRGSLTPLERDTWAAAGMAHILAISGSHVALIALIIYWLFTCGLYYCPYLGSYLAARYSIRRLAAVASIPAIIVFCLLTGAPASVNRAGIMTSTALSGLIWRRTSSALNTLGLAGLSLTLLEPTSIYDPGLLLSFSAVAALLNLPRFKLFPTLPLRSPRGFRGQLPYLILRLAKYILEGCFFALFSTWMVNLATAPITIYYFNQLSLVAPLTNLVAVPLSTVISTPLALFYALLKALTLHFHLEYPWLNYLQAGLAWILQKSLNALDYIADLGAKFPLATYQINYTSYQQLLCLTLLILWLFKLLKSQDTNLRPRYLSYLLCLAGLSGVFLAPEIEKRLTAYLEKQQNLPPKLSIIFPYVGQGDSSLVLLPHGGTMVIDGGGNPYNTTLDPGREILSPLLKRLKIPEIKILVLSHEHPDHLNGLVYLSEHFKIREFWHNVREPKNPLFTKLLSNLEKQHTNIRTGPNLPREFTQEEVQFTILYAAEALTPNNQSLILRLALKNQSILFTGDSESPTELSLAKNWTKTTILKAPHHGSLTSSTPAFLKAIAAKAAIISVGEVNLYGLPHQTILNRYNDYHMQILRTDLEGAITLTTRGDSWKILTMSGKQLEIF